MPHPQVCAERLATAANDEVQLEHIHWHHWGSRNATGRGRWLVSAEPGAEKSAPVTLYAYRRVDYPECIGRGYTRLRVETTDPALPQRTVFRLPRCS